MEEAHVTITIKPIHLERLAYWIVIIGLAVLLILAFVKDDTCEPTTASGDADENQAAAPTTGNTPTTPPTTAPSASCIDGVKNQDETDADCGGATCPKCIAGKACVAAGDCVSGYCTANVCSATAPATLSGKVEFDVTKAVASPKASNGNVKVTGLEYTIKNGMDEDLDGYIIKIFVKNKAGTRCLNQQTTGTCDDSYAEITGSAIKAGKSTTQTRTFDDATYTSLVGRYLIEDSGYDPLDASLDDFQVIAYLYDSSGSQIDGKAISDSATVNPT